ncbi:MAG: M23 family metallopeptidase [Bacteroidales bacterium]|nr:M23 family metallopeptidase [Candidatus Paceibacterota bacterium]
MKRILILSIFLFSLILLGIVYSTRFYSFEKETEDLSSEMPLETTTTTKEETVLETKISFSALEVYQGDTLVIVAENVPDQAVVRGEFDSQDLEFFSIEGKDKLFSLLGIDAKKSPGEYILSIFLSGELMLEEIIEVKKSDFYITQIVITPELEEKGLTADNISKNISTNDGVIVYEIVNKYNPEIYFNKSFVYPLDELINVGAFGNIRKDNGITIQHLGVDLDAEQGTPIYAINDGQVVFAGELTVYGKTIIIDHGLGIYSLYLHLSEFKASKGLMVERGEIIGLTGNTGWSTGPHLHLSVKANKASVDPLKFIEGFDIILKEE